MKSSLRAVATVAAILGISTAASAVETTNALTYNRIAFNALTYNALTYNRIAFNALTYNRMALNGIRVNGFRINGLNVRSNQDNSPSSVRMTSSESAGQISAALHELSQGPLEFSK
jgi:hypothetical protein